MTELLKPCAIKGCTNRTNLPMCGSHWRLVPPSLQLHLYDLRRSAETHSDCRSCVRHYSFALGRAIGIVDSLLRREATP